MKNGYQLSAALGRHIFNRHAFRILHREKVVWAGIYQLSVKKEDDAVVHMAAPCLIHEEVQSVLSRGRSRCAERPASFSEYDEDLLQGGVKLFPLSGGTGELEDKVCAGGMMRCIGLDAVLLQQTADGSGVAALRRVPELCDRREVCGLCGSGAARACTCAAALAASGDLQEPWCQPSDH